MVKDIGFEYVVGYGLIIKQPKNPSWCVLEHRLANFADDDRHPPHLPVLINSTDAMTEEEKVKKLEKDEDAEGEADAFCEHEILKHHSCASYIENHAQAAIKKILGNDAQTRLIVLEAYSDYRSEHKGVTLFLEAISLDCDSHYHPFSLSLNLDFPTIENKDKVDRDLHQVAQALGLEAEGEIGWKLLTALSFYD